MRERIEHRPCHAIRRVISDTWAWFPWVLASLRTVRAAPGGARSGVVAVEAETVRETGVAVRMVGPGPEDLVAIGANLMDGTRIRFVLETSLRTSVDAWRAADALAVAG